MLFAINESKPEVGSSSKIIEGSVISSTPIEVLLRSPPDISLRFMLPHWVC
jgi:hypothetical protein